MSNRTVPQRELRNNYGELLRAVAQGAEITITVQGEPAARLVPVARRKASLTPHELIRALGGPDSDPTGFMADVRPPSAERISGLM